MTPEGASDGATDPDAIEAKSLLRRLAGADSEVVVERADAAVDDLERAAEFVESVGLAELEVAIDGTDDEALAARGEEALAAFRRFRAAAAGDLDPADGDPDAPDEGRGAADDRRDATDPSDDRGGAGSHFHHGRGTDLRRDGEATST